MEETIAQLNLPTSLKDQTSSIAQIVKFVHHQMAHHDPSHNPQHVFRVTRLAHKLLDMERQRNTQPHSQPQTRNYIDLIVTLSALLHDITDHKYIHPGVDPNTFLYQYLLEQGYTPEISSKVQTIVSNVSFSGEKKHPDKPHHLIDNGFPELAIVQDSDRLDAIGAVGVGRCFTYLGARAGGGQGGRWELDEAIEHFVEKLERLEELMKTESGRELARVRTERLREFRRWWAEETGYVPEIA